MWPATQAAPKWLIPLEGSYVVTANRLCLWTVLTWIHKIENSHPSVFNPEKPSQAFVISAELQLSGSENETWPVTFSIKPVDRDVCHRWSVEVRTRTMRLAGFPVSSSALQLLCLPSSGCASEAKSHPSGFGVRPHLPTSEFVCVDELWT